MATSTTKRVLVQRFDRDTVSGFVQPDTFLTTDGAEVLNQAGSVAIVPFPEIKTIFFVRDFTDSLDGFRRTFLSRPKTAGLWLRLLFRDGDTLEAVMPNDLLQCAPAGFSLIPPDTAQRIFVPRAALTTVQVVSVVSSPLRSGRKKSEAAKEQIGLFEQNS